ncbi:MAG: hypothetical protein QNJ23_06825 [Woeseiaceae bacterium]|nr:hypothetical protein [Woeseiaceae bacterium]
MNVAKAVISLITVGLFGAAVAQDEARVKIEVKTDDGHGDGMHVVLDGAELGFNPQDMQQGENQAFVDEQGRTILITREADGFRFDVEGKSIKVPLLNGDAEKMVEIHAEHDKDVDVHVVHDVIEIDGDHDGEHTVKIVKKVEVVSE